ARLASLRLLAGEGLAALGQHLAVHLERVDHDRHAAIGRLLEDDLGHFLPRGAHVERGLDVDAELLGSMQHGERGHRAELALLRRDQLAAVHDAGEEQREIARQSLVEALPVLEADLVAHALEQRGARALGLLADRGVVDQSHGNPRQSSVVRIFASSSTADSIGLCAQSMSIGVTPSRAAYSAARGGVTAASRRQRMYVHGRRSAWKRRMSTRSVSGRSGCGVSRGSVSLTRGSPSGRAPLHPDHSKSAGYWIARSLDRARPCIIWRPAGVMCPCSVVVPCAGTTAARNTSRAIRAGISAATPGSTAPLME